MKQLAQNKLIVSMVVALFIFATGLFAMNKMTWINSGMFYKDGSLTRTSFQPEITEVDTDFDGLPDWEEILYQSDAHNPDSDSDGMRDGAEVRSGHDPIKKGPQDFLASVLLAESLASTTDDVDLAEKSYYISFLTERGEALRKYTIKDIASKVNTQEFVQKMSFVDLKISSDNSVTALRTYGNELSRITKKYAKPQPYKNETQILKTALQNKDERLLREIELPAIGYRNLTSELKSMQVPSLFARYHLQLINSYDVISRSLFAMKDAITNPPHATAAELAYSTHLTYIQIAFLAIMKEYEDRGIIFLPNEEGHVLNFQKTPTPKSK